MSTVNGPFKDQTKREVFTSKKYIFQNVFKNNHKTAITMITSHVQYCRLNLGRLPNCELGD